MFLSGNLSENKISSEEVSIKTLECLKNCVPNEVPGIAFFITEDNPKLKPQKI